VLTAYHNDKKIKTKYLDRVKKHRLADEIVHGRYWESGKGCAVGCTVHGSDHNAYETELGIPAWVAHLEDYLFEEMENGDAQNWPERLLKAIPVGASNWDEIEHKYHHWLLVDPEAGVLRYTANAADPELREQIETSIKTVADLHERRVSKDSKDFESARSAAESARSAAESAARSARSAAWSASWSAAESAAESAARSAARSARSAARSARSAVRSAGSAARSAAIKRQADKLIELLESMKVTQLT